MSFHNKFKSLIFVTSIFSASISNAQVDLFGYLHTPKSVVSQKLSSTTSLNTISSDVFALADEDECLSVDGDVTLEFDVPCIDIISDDDTVIDLDGFTVSGDVLFLQGSRDTSIVIQDGTIDGGAIILFTGSDHLIDNVTLSNYEGDFAVIIPSGLIIDSIFENNGVALDLFYGGSIGVIDNTFINNRIAINIASDNDSFIADNVFEANEIGVRLYDEDLSGVNNTVIEDNRFVSNDIGVFLNAQEAVNGTIIEGNTFRTNSSSGIVVLLDCFMFFSSECAGRNTLIERNFIYRNGFEPTSISGYIQGSDFEPVAYDMLAEDAVLVLGSETDQSANGVTLTNNFLYLNSALGANAENVVDGGSNYGFANGDSRDCVGIDC